jgi:hypothetical protein
MRRRVISALVLIVSVAPTKSPERTTRPSLNVALNSVPSTSIDRSSAAVAQRADAPAKRAAVKPATLGLNWVTPAGSAPLRQSLGLASPGWQLDTDYLTIERCSARNAIETCAIKAFAVSRQFGLSRRRNSRDGGNRERDSKDLHH